MAGEPEPVEAEVVRCAACGAERDLVARSIGDRTVFLCPFCLDTGSALLGVGRRMGMIALARLRERVLGR